MFKWLPAFEKEFDIEEVAQATDGWVRVVMIVFVGIVLLAAIFI